MELERVIYKYPVPVTPGVMCYDLPRGAEVLCVQRQGGGENDIFIWALVDKKAEHAPRWFKWYPTGLTAVMPKERYVGTIPMEGGKLVWHLFEHGAGVE